MSSHKRYIKRYKEIYAKTPLVGNLGGVGGEFRLILYNENGGIAQDTGWFKNLITNTGLIHFNGSVNSWHSYCHIGSSNTAPAFTDTALGGHLAYKLSSFSLVNGPTPIAPNYEFYSTKAWRFDAGLGTGTIRELGLGYQSTNTNMSVRALVSPEVVKGASQVLDVYYRFTVWPSGLGVDATGVIAIAGEDYNYIVRRQNIDAANNGTFTTFKNQSGFDAHTAWAGTIGTELGYPTDTAGTGWTESEPSLVSRGSGFYEWGLKWGLSQGNDALGIRSISTTDSFGYGNTSRGWQIRFGKVIGDTTIPKDGTKEFLLNFRMNWVRH